MSKTHNLLQGTPEWLDFRKKHYGASEAAAMLGISPYKSRDALIREKATGITPEVDEGTQMLFDEGHRLEAEARPIAEGIIGEDLYQPTMSLEVDGLPLSCSCDGLTLMEDMAWECKTMNAKLEESLPDEIPEQYLPQLEQTLMITKADKILFMAYGADGEHLECWYESNPKLRKKITNGWKQFADDVKAYKPVEIVAEAVADRIESLPALNIQITGGVTKTNLADYKRFALDFIQSINTDLKTDDDFATADAMVKFCGKTEKELDAVKQAALSQTADIAELFSTIDGLKAEMRTKRLALDKLVKAKKQAIRESIVLNAKSEFADFIMDKNSLLSEGVSMPNITPDYGSAIKNKRTIESLRNAVNTEVARCKIEASEVADLMIANTKALAKLIEKEGHLGFLFRDLQDIAAESQQAFLGIAKSRIAEHRESEKVRMEAERERIREEEKAKVEAKERESAAERIRKDAEKKAEREIFAIERANHYNAKTSSAESIQATSAEPVPVVVPLHKDATIMSELAGWCYAWHISRSAAEGLVEIVERYMPE